MYTPTERSKALLRYIDAKGGFLTQQAAYDYLQETRDPDSDPLTNTKSLYNIIFKLEQANYLKRVKIIDGKFVLLGINGARYIAGKKDLPLTGQGRYLWVKSVPKNVDHELKLQAIHGRIQDEIYRTRGLRYSHHMFERELQRYKAPVIHRLLDGKECIRQPVVDLYVEAQYRAKKTLRIPLEYDSGETRDPKLTNDKLLPLMEYVHSPAYHQFGGKPSYLWWITGKGSRRVQGLKQKLEDIGMVFKKRGFDEGRNMAENFLIASLDDFHRHNIFTDAFFHRPFSQDKVSIFDLL